MSALRPATPAFQSNFGSFSENLPAHGVTSSASSSSASEPSAQKRVQTIRNAKLIKSEMTPPIGNRYAFLSVQDQGKYVITQTVFGWKDFNGNKMDYIDSSGLDVSEDLMVDAEDLKEAVAQAALAETESDESDSD